MAELEIRLKKPQNLPEVGRFTDTISLENAEQPVYMYQEEEEIEDDPEDMEKEDVVKDGAYFAQLKKQRHVWYRKKEILKLEDSTEREEGGAPLGIIFEGEPWEPGLHAAGGEGSKMAPPTNRHARKETVAATDKPFNYALLQVIDTKDAHGKSKKEVNLVPVKGFYLFKKPSVMQEKSLDLIDDDFETKMQEDKAKLQRYQNLFRAKPGALTVGTETTDETEGSAEPGKFVLPPVFGMAVKQKVRKGLKRGANTKSFLDETGADMDAIKNAESTYQGDYEVYRPNDDMAYGDEGMAFEQAAEEEVEERETQKIETLQEQDETEENDSSDDEDDAKAGGAGGAGGTGGAGTAGGEDVATEEKGVLSAGGKTSGLLDDQMLLAARQAGKKMAQEDRKRAKGGLSVAGGGEAATQAQGEGEPSRKRARGADSPDDDAAAESNSSSSKKNKTFNLDEEGVRDYIRSQGGLVSVDDLKTQFKAQVKALNKADKANKKAGLEAITNLIKTLCAVSMDPVKGKMVSLK